VAECRKGLAVWAFRLRRLDGPAFTWPLFLFAGRLPDSWRGWAGSIRAVRCRSRRARSCSRRSGRTTGSFCPPIPASCRTICPRRRQRHPARCVLSFTSSRNWLEGWLCDAIDHGQPGESSSSGERPPVTAGSRQRRGCLATRRRCRHPFPRGTPRAAAPPRPVRTGTAAAARRTAYGSSRRRT
jgi:hypothetical protein